MDILRAEQLAQGDVIRLSDTGVDLTLTEPPTPYPGQEGLLRLTLDGEFVIADGLAYPAAATVIAVSAPRTLQARCLLCPDTYPFDTDLADPDRGANPRGLCGPCHDRTADTVARAYVTEQGARRP